MGASSDDGPDEGPRRGERGTGPGATPTFEETIGYPGPRKTTNQRRVKVVIVVVMTTLITGAMLAAVPSVELALMVGAGAAIFLSLLMAVVHGLTELGLGWSQSRKADREIHTVVTDNGLEVRINWDKRLGPSMLAAPFEDITGVEVTDFTETDPEDVKRTFDIDKEEQWDADVTRQFFTFHDERGHFADHDRGYIRVEQHDDTVTFVESERPAELAREVAAGASHVSHIDYGP